MLKSFAAGIEIRKNVLLIREFKMKLQYVVKT